MKSTSTSRRQFLASTGAIGASLVLLPAAAHERFTLAQFHKGIDVRERHIQIPWLITESELFEYIPRDAFTFSVAGWPMLRFTMLGINAVFGFNFVTHPEERLIEIRYQNMEQQSIDHTFSVTSARLKELLPTPQFADMEYQHLRWNDDCVFIDNMVGSGLFSLLKRNATSHDLSIFFSAGMPKTRTTDS